MNSKDHLQFVFTPVVIEDEFAPADTLVCRFLAVEFSYHMLYKLFLIFSVETPEIWNIPLDVREVIKNIRSLDGSVDRQLAHQVIFLIYVIPSHEL